MTREIIHHFVCSSCRGWWSIAHQEEMEPRKWYCPWCKEENDLRGVVLD